MKVRHLKSFPQHTNYEEYKDGGNINKPHVAYCIKENEVHYAPYIIKTVSTVNATQFESFPFNFYWRKWEGLENKKSVGIGWDDDAMANHSVHPDNAAYFVPNSNFDLYIYSNIPNTQKMEITFRFAHEYDEDRNITLTYNGVANTVRIPIGGTPSYTLTLNGGDNTITMESSAFPDIRITVTEIKIYYAE